MKFEWWMIGRIFFYIVSLMTIYEFVITPESGMITIPQKVVWA
jgi:hypothetical protein